MEHLGQTTALALLNSGQLRGQGTQLLGSTLRLRRPIGDALLQSLFLLLQLLLAAADSLLSMFMLSNSLAELMLATPRPNGGPHNANQCSFTKRALK
jgi:hypothetical protein